MIKKVRPRITVQELAILEKIRAGVMPEPNGEKLTIKIKNYLKKAGTPPTVGELSTTLDAKQRDVNQAIRELYAAGYNVTIDKGRVIFSTTVIPKRPDFVVDVRKSGNVIRFGAGCTQDQTPFMRKKKLSAHLGGWIIEVHTDARGAITRFKSEWIKFYNKKYYSPWSYKTGDKKAQSFSKP